MTTPQIRQRMDRRAEELALLQRAQDGLVRRCPLHGPLVGVRYCPECASSGRPWSDTQACDADLEAAEQQVRDWAAEEQQACRELRTWAIVSALVIAAIVSGALWLARWLAGGV
uniref:Uncharacterized protein n=1 Tax=viral metagenome TaxID=1070528 RepID=A0A6M3JZL8_9ZZZZ